MKNVQWDQCVMIINVNLPSLTRIQCVWTRTVKISGLCGQYSQQRKNHAICSQCQDQQCHNLVTRKGNLYMMTSVNLQCILTRTVKLICGQWSQQKNQIICGQVNQQVTRRWVVTRTVNLQDAIRKSTQWYQCVMTRTVNQPNLMWSDGTHFSAHRWSVPKAACNQIGTQPEITRNIYSTSKCCYLEYKDVSRLQKLWDAI